MPYYLLISHSQCCRPPLSSAPLYLWTLWRYRNPVVIIIIIISMMINHESRVVYVFVLIQAEELQAQEVSQSVSQ